MKFKTYKEAEQFYFEKISATNNMHEEEDQKLARWLEEQELGEEEIEEELKKGLANFKKNN